MAWSYEAKAGVRWAIAVLVLALIGVGLEIGLKEFLPASLLLPIVGWLIFFAWVYRIKK